MTDPLQDPGQTTPDQPAPHQPRPGVPGPDYPSPDKPDPDGDDGNPDQLPPLEDIPPGGGGDEIGEERVPERF